MNGMVSFMPTSNKTMSYKDTSASKTDRSNENKTSNSFLQTLQEVSTSPNDHVSSTNIELGDNELSNEDRELMELMQQWVEKLPLDDQYLNESMLDGFLTEEVIEQLSMPMEEFLSFFQQEVPLKDLLSDDLLNNPFNMFAIIIAFSHLDNKYSPQFQGEVNLFSLVQEQVAKYFPHLQMDKDHGSWSQLMGKFAEQLELFHKGNSKDAQFQLNSYLTQVQEKINEKDVAKYLYNRMADAADSNKKGIPQLVAFDSTNSHMARLQQFIIHRGELEAARPSQEQLMRQIENILARSQFKNLGNGMQQLSVRLHPASLGRLDITIQQINGVIVAKMMTTTTIAKELIESQLHHLRNAFSAQQLNVDRIEITHQQQAETTPFKEREEKEHESHHEQDGQKDYEEPNEDESFATFLEETINAQV